MEDRIGYARILLSHTVKNGLMAIPPIRAWRLARTRTAPGDEGASQLERYAWEPYRALVDAVGAAELRGAKVAEIGPGDHIPVALLVLGVGAERYTCIDRFPGNLSGARSKWVYRLLMDDLASRESDMHHTLQKRGIDANRFPEQYRDLVDVRVGPIEDPSTAPAASVDVLFSYNTVEHVSDIAGFARASHRLLRAGGVAVHRVDFGPHDDWQNRANLLEWLCPSDLVWRAMGSQRGLPNRFRFHEVCRTVEQAGLQLQAEVQESVDPTHLEAIRPRLARRFRQMPDESILVRTATLICRKPNGPSR